MATATDTAAGRRMRGRLAAGLAGIALLAPALAGAAERTATVQLVGRELTGAIVPMKDVATWRVTDLGTHGPVSLPGDQIASIDALRISGTCRIGFGRIGLRNGNTVEIEGNLRDIFEIPVQSMTFRIADPTGNASSEESIRCNAWKRIDFDPPAAAKPES